MQIFRRFLLSCSHSFRQFSWLALQLRINLILEENHHRQKKKLWNCAYRWQGFCILWLTFFKLKSESMFVTFQSSNCPCLFSEKFYLSHQCWKEILVEKTLENCFQNWTIEAKVEVWSARKAKINWTEFVLLLSNKLCFVTLSIFSEISPPMGPSI